MADNRSRSSQFGGALQYETDFVVADPHIVYYDAVMHSPWNHNSGGHLPQREDWSTYRYTVKDIILGIATHRFNKNTRRLEIRAYFVGEHPLFKELEPTKAMMIVLFCQSYQSGGALNIFFEHGVPFDFCRLIEDALGIVISGHERLIPSETGSRMFAALSSFAPQMQNRISAQDVDVDRVCFNTYRGTWAPNHIKSLLQRGIPLKWLFKQRPDPIRNPVIYGHLMNHLRAALLEEYAIRRLEDRQMGESLGNPVHREDEKISTFYWSEVDLNITDDETTIEIPARERFCLIPVIPKSVRSIHIEMQSDLHRARKAKAIGKPILVVPMDFIYLNEGLQEAYRSAVLNSDAKLIVVGLTSAQLLSEAEFNLSVTSAQTDPDEVDIINVDRYPD